MDCKEQALSEEYADGIIDFPSEIVGNMLQEGCYIPVDAGFGVAYQSRRITPDLNVGEFQYPYIPKLFGLMQTSAVTGIERRFDPSALEASGIRKLQGPPLNLRGQGTIIAFIDTGIEYTNRAFLDENGKSRILAIWDQTVQEGEAPEGFVFGTEYTNADINKALESQNPMEEVSVRDPLRHGTNMAGIAAGSIVAGGSVYIGAAPEAEIVVVKLKEAKEYLRQYYFIPEGVPAYEENDIMLGIAYANRFAIEFRKPLIICLGMGTSYGDHAGNSMLGRYLNKVAMERSRVVVVCGGNEGNTNHHYTSKLSDSEKEQEVELRVGEKEQGFVMEFWGNMPDTYQVSLRSPGGESIPPIRIEVEQRETFRFVFEETVIEVRSVRVETDAGAERITFRFIQPTAGIWILRVGVLGEVYSGRFHIWLPISEFLNSDTYFLNPSPDVTLTDPAMADGLISVSAYDHRNNSFYIESGRGFSRTGNIKPDIVAPGVNVPTLYGERSGSSLAAAYAAGAGAQFMQWAVVEGNSPLADTKEVRNFFIKGATRSAGIEYPNKEWGYGTLNIYGVFENLRRNI